MPSAGILRHLSSGAAVDFTMHALAFAVQTAVDAVAFAIKTSFDSITLAIEASFNPVTFEVQSFGQSRFTVFQGSLGFAIQPVIDVGTSLIETAIDIVTSLVQPLVDDIALMIQPVLNCLTGTIRQSGGCGDDDQQAEHS